MHLLQLVFGATHVNSVRESTSRRVGDVRTSTEKELTRRDSNIVSHDSLGDRVFWTHV